MRTLLLFLAFPFTLLSQNLMLPDSLRFLALGDSYTIGESVAVNGRWPVQLGDSLSQRGFSTDTLRIIATTGWRTDDLINAIKGQQLHKQRYNMVSLLIGVNNQYQGRPFSQYQQEFPALLDSAIRYAGGNKQHVFVVSIPDYAYTPFGQQSANPALISAEIDKYNLYNKRVADSMQVIYFNITPISRQGVQQPSYVAADGLHPSAVQYAQWVNLMLLRIRHEVQLGIKSEADNSVPVITPNPGNGSFTVQFRGKSTQAHAIEIYDSTGNFLFSKTVESGPAQLSLGDYSDGLYIARISTGNKQVTKKLVKVSR